MRTQFLISAAQVEQLPATGLPEVAFLGRSNVGKSSLLNALVQARIARTSSTPGRTQQVNLFLVHAGFGDFGLADLPGTGFAKAPRAVRAAFAPLVDAYLERRAELRAVLWLLDARRDPGPAEVSLGRRLREGVGARAEVQVLLTKADKIPKAQRKPRATRVATALGLSADSVLLTSASSRIGLEEVLDRVRGWTTASSD